MEYDYGTITDCANKCRGLSSIFAVGTQDYGPGGRCNWKTKEDKCSCLCETTADEGQCIQETHPGYRLYKYQPRGLFIYRFYSMYYSYLYFLAKHTKRVILIYDVLYL